MVALGILAMATGAIASFWISLLTSAANVTLYSERQSDQMRTMDYLRRDIRRAISTEIVGGTQLRLILPKYYNDTLEDDLPRSTRTPVQPSVVNGEPVYASPVTVLYFVRTGTVFRSEGSNDRAISDADTGFTLAFQSVGVSGIRCQIGYNQPLIRRQGRSLQRNVSIVCEQRNLF